MTIKSQVAGHGAIFQGCIVNAINAIQTAANHERLAKLRQLNLLDSPSEEAFDRLTKLASIITRSPISLVSLIDADRQFFKSQIGLPEPWASLRETPLSHSFCMHVVDENAPLVVEDARQHPILRHNLAVPNLDVVGYLGMPLTTSDGFGLGSFCVIDSSPRLWTQRDLEILHDLAQMVMTEIELRAQVAARKRAEAAVREYADTLEVKVAERTHELQIAYGRLQTIDKLRSKLITDLAHELRTPIANIGLYLDLLLQGKVASRARYEAVLREESDRLATLSESVLAFSRLHQDLNSATLGSVDLVALTAESVAACAVQAEKAGLHISFSPRAQTAHVWGYADHLAAAVAILLKNALDYTAAGTIVVGVHHNETQDQMMITVEDTGIGMDEDDLAHCFDRFYRGKRVGQQNIASGSGLGLSRAKSIVEFHDGRLEVESEVDRGTMFTICLPVRPHQ